MNAQEEAVEANIRYREKNRKRLPCKNQDLVRKGDFLRRKSIKS